MNTSKIVFCVVLIVFLCYTVRSNPNVCSVTLRLRGMDNCLVKINNIDGTEEKCAEKVAFKYNECAVTVHQKNNQSCWVGYINLNGRETRCNYFWKSGSGLSIMKV